MKPISTTLASVAFALAAFQMTHAPAGAQALPTAPPAPPPPNATPTPMLPPGALPSPSSSNVTVTLPQKHAKATPAPPKDTAPMRAGLDGVWEVQLQQTSGVEYAHFKIVQSGNILTGTYLDTANKRYPLSGSVDGKTVRLVVSLPNGSDLVFNGTEDANTDMVGTLDAAQNVIGFTAAYRPKYKWTDNLNPSPTGGLGTGPSTPY